MNENASSAMYVDVNSQRYPLKLGLIYMFGREPSKKDSCPEHIINLDDKDVDEKHCCVADSVEDGAFVFDLLSKYGTFVNGERLKPLEKTLIKHGDVMRLGTTRNVKFCSEQMDTSHNSSGYGEANKNTSGIICSSPESTSHRDSRVKRLNSLSNKSHDDSDTFLVPALPVASSREGRIADAHSFLSDMSSSRVSLGLNSSKNQSRYSDSFTIPETQHVKPRTSTASNLSVAESEAEEDRSKSGFNLDSFEVSGNDDDDFCIPETQDMLPSSQMTRPLKDGKVVNGLKTLEEKSVDLNDSEDDDLLDGSQFRICTQDYNEGFGEEDNESMLHSQVIPLIKHTTVLLNGSTETRTPEKKPDEDKLINEANAALEEDKDLANINWSSSAKEDAEQNKIIASNCSTPDIFDFAAFDTSKAENGNVNSGNLFEDNAPNALEDVEDYMATQVFPSKNTNTSSHEKDKVIKEKDILSGKDDEQYLTLSDKENLHPDTLEPITDLPPTQLFATREVSGERSLASTSLRKSGLNQTEPKQIPVTAETVPAPSIVIESVKILMPPAASLDEEDDILTQPYPQPVKRSTATVLDLPKNNCFNSTLLDEKAMDKHPASFFAEMEKTPKKVQTPTNTCDVFKMPEVGLSNYKKSSSAASTASSVTMCSESDMELLMCTPQLIKDHLQFSKADDLRKHILAAKNKNLFGDDTDEGEDTEDDRNSRDKCLVQLINVPKDSKDFDKLLPHLKNDDNRFKRKSILTDEQQAAKEAYKEYKFNLSFGNEQEKSRPSSSKSATLSRDERHVARDKERAIEQKRVPKSTSISDDKKQVNSGVTHSGRRTRHDAATTTAKATDAGKVKDKGVEEPPSNTKQKEEGGNTRLEKEQQEAALKKNEKSSLKNKEDKDAKKNPEKPKKAVNDADDTLKSKKEAQDMDAKKNPEKSNKVAKDADDKQKSKKEVEDTDLKKNKSTKVAKDTDDKHQKSKKEVEETVVKKNPVKSNKVAKDTDDKHEKSKTQVEETSKNRIASTATNKKVKAKIDKEEETRPKRVSKRIISLDKAQDSSNKQQKSTERKTELPKVRLTRLRSISGDKEKPATKDKKGTSSSAVSVASSDELDLIPTQPLRRTTRTTSRSNQKDSIEGPSSAASTSSRASSANRSSNRSSSRFSVSNNAVANESAAKVVPTATPSSSKPAVERKRRAEVPVPPQPNTEEKRLKRTTSQDSKTSPKPIPTTPLRCLISMTMVDPVQFKELAIKADGVWAVAKDPADSNVLVMDKAFRTYKFLLAMARGIPIVTSQWLKQVNDTKSLKKAPINEYLFQDAVFEKRHKFSLAKSLQMAKANNCIFKDYEFVMTSNIQPQPAEIQAIVEAAGGTVLKKGPSPARDNQHIYLVSSVDDRKDWHKFRRLNKNIIIVSTEAIMTSVMRQNCTPLSNYVLS